MQPGTDIPEKPGMFVAVFVMLFFSFILNIVGKRKNVKGRKKQINNL